MMLERKEPLPEFLTVPCGEVIGKLLLITLRKMAKVGQITTLGVSA